LLKEHPMTDHEPLRRNCGSSLDRPLHHADTGVGLGRGRHTVFRRRVLAAGVGMALATGCFAFAHDASHDGASGTLQSTGLSARSADEAAFLAENDAAMKKMMMDMEIKPTGDIDADFVAMMVPHHQGAVDMARAELRYGRNEQLRRIAQEIVVTQMQEITAMHLALGQPLPPSVASPTQGAGGGEGPMAPGAMKHHD
jgi:hypothetical protein